MRFLAMFGVLVLAACEQGGSDQVIDGGNRLCGAVICAPTEFCDFGWNTCGVPQETATCQPRTKSCAGPIGSVCGCDGQMHGDACATYGAGVDLDANGNCPLEADRFVCGFKQCSLAGEYCFDEPALGGSAEPNSRFRCAPIPPACSASPTCECLRTSESCISMCSGTSSTGFVAICAPA